jgi:hypothetical protein
MVKGDNRWRFTGVFVFVEIPENAPAPGQNNEIL